MKPLLEQLQEWFRGLAHRERLMVSICALAVALTTLYLGAWEPLVQAHQQGEESLISARALGERLEQVAGIKKLHAGSDAANASHSLSLLAAVDQSSKSGVLGKPLSRIQPDGDTAVKVWIDGVAFDSLLRWMTEMDEKYGVTVDTVDIERADAPGTVNARLSLVRS